MLCFSGKGVLLTAFDAAVGVHQLAGIGLGGEQGVLMESNHLHL